MPLNPGKPACTANLKNCPPKRGGCGYRYLKTDTKWQDGGSCPVCGFPRRCTHSPVTGFTVCQVHGAGSPHKGRFPVKTNKDIFKPNLPQRMLEVYYSALSDQRLYQLRSDISILEARKHELLERAKKDDAPAYRFHLKILADEFRQAQAKAEVEEMKLALNNLLLFIDKGHAYDLAWEQTEQTIKRKSDLIEKEYRHLEITHKVITVEKFMADVEQLLKIIKSRFGDNGYQLVLGDVYELLNIGNPDPAQPHPLIVENPHGQ